MISFVQYINEALKPNELNVNASEYWANAQQYENEYKNKPVVIKQMKNRRLINVFAFTPSIAAGLKAIFEYRGEQWGDDNSESSVVVPCLNGLIVYTFAFGIGGTLRKPEYLLFHKNTSFYHGVKNITKSMTPLQIDWHDAVDKELWFYFEHVDPQGTKFVPLDYDKVAEQVIKYNQSKSVRVKAKINELSATKQDDSENPLDADALLDLLKQAIKMRRKGESADSLIPKLEASLTSEELSEMNHDGDRLWNLFHKIAYKLGCYFPEAKANRSKLLIKTNLLKLPQ